MYVRLFALVFLCALDCRATIGGLDRNVALSHWERTELDGLAEKYEGIHGFSRANAGLPADPPANFRCRVLVEDFVALCCRRFSDTNLYPYLEEMAVNPIGRELIYRTMAKIAPRQRCLESIDGVLGCAAQRLEVTEGLGVLANFMKQLGMCNFGRSISERELLRSVCDGNWSSRFNTLFNSPVIFRRRISPVVTSRNKHTDKKVFSCILSHMKIYRDMFYSFLYKKRFDLRLEPLNGDYYSDGIVSITGRGSRLSFIKGPRLRGTSSRGVIGVVAGLDVQTSEEVLFHEFSHYFRISLENKPSAGGFMVIKRVLCREGFSEQYLDFLQTTWTDAEELNAITGLVVEGGRLFYDRLNESEFNLRARKGPGIRISHSINYYTRVPYALLSLIERGRGKNVALSCDETRDYNPAVDVI